ncbi:chitosanase [Modestobacter sp. DSM 44400]|uniref:chitosanase n=1 Tax=Modestobacter sp. DSM 44400 TaxID=1550230 RepID=UPI00352B1B63
MGAAARDGAGHPGGPRPAFAAAWRAAAGPFFRRAQDDRVDAGNSRAAVDQALADGLPVLGQSAHFDAMVLHGPGEQSDAFGGIRAAARRAAPAPAVGGDVRACLSAFLGARSAAMCTEVAHRDTTQVAMPSGSSSPGATSPWTAAHLVGVRRPVHDAPPRRPAGSALSRRPSRTSAVGAFGTNSAEAFGTESTPPRRWSRPLVTGRSAVTCAFVL